ncbi:MAG: N-acetylglucosamine kinase [Spirosomataceae bacterium]
MILIADSGSTKTDWRLIAADGSIQQAKTVGLNPYYQDSTSIATELTQHLLPLVQESVTDIYFYGTGCAGEEPCAIVRNGLKAVFATAEVIEVESDMLGAARGLCGHEPGIACILGTGSNNCLYDGRDIAAKIPSLGFWLGDEGSGGYLGKTLVVAFLQKEMPDDLAEKFAKRYGLNREIVLENAYKKPFPNRYFAGFSKFLFDNRSHPFAYQLVYDAFGEFLSKYVCKLADYQQNKVHFVGSIAFYYSDILRRVATEKGITVGHIMETPIAGLTLYHRQG